MGWRRIRMGLLSEWRNFRVSGRGSSPSKRYLPNEASCFSSFCFCQLSKTGAYDSCRRKKPASVLTLQTSVNTQKIHLQPIRCTITPPNRGPSVGPSKGPRRYQPNMPARCDGGNISLMVPPPFAMPTLPKKPDNVRIAMSVWIFGLSADGICSIVNIVKQIRYSFLLPKVSDNGARNSGPMPSMITKPVVHPITVSEVVFKDLAICSIPGVKHRRCQRRE